MNASSLPDLFPGFEEKFVSTSSGDLFCRIGGEGPPLLLLHGYPQTHVMWHRVAPEMAKHFTVIIPDLPGYGQSAIPPLSNDHSAYSKRSMALAMVELMSALGHETFTLAGHDRGARVSYRMALDHPEKVERIAVLDILPTRDYWQKMDKAFALKIYHWSFLAQPAPFPETLISAAAAQFLDHTLSSWTASKDLSAFHPDALQHYHAFFAQPERVAASCEDYRAGATIDDEHDQQTADTGGRILCPLLTVWGAAGIAQSSDTPLTVWQRWAADVEGGSTQSGHFMAEEDPDGLMENLLPFLLSPRPHK